MKIQKTYYQLIYKYSNGTTRTISDINVTNLYERVNEISKNDSRLVILRFEKIEEIKQITNLIIPHEITKFIINYKIKDYISKLYNNDIMFKFNYNGTTFDSKNFTVEHFIADDLRCKTLQVIIE